MHTSTHENPSLRRLSSQLASHLHAPWAAAGGHRTTIESRRHSCARRCVCTRAAATSRHVSLLFGSIPSQELVSHSQVPLRSFDGALNHTLRALSASGARLLCRFNFLPQMNFLPPIINERDAFACDHKQIHFRAGERTTVIAFMPALAPTSPTRFPMHVNWIPWIGFPASIRSSTAPPAAPQTWQLAGVLGFFAGGALVALCLCRWTACHRVNVLDPLRKSQRTAAPPKVLVTTADHQRVGGRIRCKLANRLRGQRSSREEYGAMMTSDAQDQIESPAQVAAL